MAEVLIGTESGTWIWRDGKLQLEPEAPAASFLAPAGNQVWALTKAGALWQRSPSGTWQLINPQRAAEEIWSFAADAQLSDRLYLGVSPAMLYRSDDGGDRWQQLQRGLPEKFDIMIKALAAAADGSVYAGAGSQFFASFDGGETWQLLTADLPPIQALAAI